MAEPGIFNSKTISMSLADAIRRQAAAQRKFAKEEKERKEGIVSDPFQQLIDQIQSITVEPTPYDDLLQQATASAGAQFDPLIQQLEAEMERTKKRGKANQKEAREMYNALAQDIAAQLPKITQQMAAASQEAENRYNQTQQALKDQYAQQAQAQNELFKKLGIQAAAPEASQQAMEDQAYFQNQISTDKAAALQLLDEMKAADVSYNRETSSNTRLAGENVAQDIAQQLEEYLQTAGSKLAGLKASRESAIQAMLMELQRQDQQRIAQQEEREYRRLMDLFNLQLRLQEIAAKNNGGLRSDSIFKGTVGPAGASNYLSEIYGDDRATPSAIMEAIQDVMSSQAAITGKYEHPELKDMSGKPMLVPTTPEYLQDLLRKRLTEERSKAPLTGTSYSDYDINNAINALLAYMGKFR